MCVSFIYVSSFVGDVCMLEIVELIYGNRKLGIPKTFLSMLFSSANMSVYSPAGASEPISFTSIKPTVVVVDIWTVNKSDFKTYD